MHHLYPLLSLSPSKQDHQILREILEGSPWLIRETHSLRSALQILEEYRIPILICERDLHPGTWKDLLEQIAVVPNPPSVIVASRQADERLWIEALSAGAYDVLAKPLDRAELQRTLSDAWQQWHDQFAEEGMAKAMAAAG